MIQIKRPEEAHHAFQTCWNIHDVEALGTLFHEDATFVNRFGHYVRGVDAIIELHASIHATIYSDSQLANELIDLVPIGDDAVVQLKMSFTLLKLKRTGPLPNAERTSARR